MSQIVGTNLFCRGNGGRLCRRRRGGVRRGRPGDRAAGDAAVAVVAGHVVALFVVFVVGGLQII